LTALSTDTESHDAGGHRRNRPVRNPVGERREAKVVDPLMAGFMDEAGVGSVVNIRQWKYGDSFQPPGSTRKAAVVNDRDTDAFDIVFDDRVAPVVEHARHRNQVEEIIVVTERPIELLRDAIAIEV